MQQPPGTSSSQLSELFGGGAGLWRFILSVSVPIFDGGAGEAINLLKKNGAVVLRWPAGLLQQLRKASDEALNKRADEFGSAGDSSYRRVLKHMRDYIQASAEFNDFGDVNQGLGQLKTSPLPVPFRQP